VLPKKSLLQKALDMNFRNESFAVGPPNQLSTVYQPQDKMQVVVQNESAYPIVYSSQNVQPGKMVVDSIPLETKFYAKLPDGKMVSMGTVFLLREAKSVALENHVGPPVDSVLPKGKTGIIKLGVPLQYTDMGIYSQKTTLRSYTGGVPWVDIVNMTNVILTFFDGKQYPAPSFTVKPGDSYRYKGRYHWGVNYGTWITNLEGIFCPAQILGPITHLMYGVL
jgi:hypothetical protein